MGAIDLAYHVRAGNEIIESSSLPATDTYTFSITGSPWSDQQWASQVLLALAHRAGGWATLKALQGLLACIAFGLVYVACRAGGAPPRRASLLTLGGFVVSAPALVLRPQLLAVPLFGLALWALASRHARPHVVWLLPLLAVVTVNLHGSFVLIPALAALAWVEEAARRSPTARTLALVSVAAVLGTLANPFGLGAWTYAYSLSTNQTIRSSVGEWVPVSLSTLPGALVLLSALGVALFFARTRQSVPWSRLLELGLFFVLALTAIRGSVWWAMVAPIVLSNVRDHPASASGDGARRESSLPAYGVIASLVALLLVLLPWWKGAGYEQHLADVPPGITDAVRALPAGSRLFAHQPWGSWFEFELPDKPVFVDSRIEIYPEAIWDDYGQVAFAGAGWREVLERWQPDAIVAEAGWELIPYLKDEPGWEIAYEDEDGVLFVREP
jgi:hypothetical protein